MFIYVFSEILHLFLNMEQETSHEEYYDNITIAVSLRFDFTPNFGQYIIIAIII